ncbi:MAG: DUF2207 domain-containing protein [Alphaproteobacteria bacterium]|nr:DUF2207 domain-containing protein [Alphaproteobacteria bacterium]
MNDTIDTTVRALAQMEASAWAVLAGSLGSLVACATSVALARRRPHAEAPRAEPPAGISPAGARFIRTRSLDGRTLAAALGDLAAKRYLTVEQDEGGGRLVKALGDPAPLAPSERVFAERLLRWRSTLAIAPRNAAIWAPARKALGRALEREYESRVRGRALPGALACLLVALAGAAAGRALEPAAPWQGLLFVLGAGACLAILAYREIRAPAALGREVLGEIEGFRAYLSGAPVADARPLTAELCRAYLPYAVALDAEEAFAARCARELPGPLDTDDAAAPTPAALAASLEALTP